MKGWTGNCFDGRTAGGNEGNEANVVRGTIRITLNCLGQIGADLTEKRRDLIASRPKLRTKRERNEKTQNEEAEKDWRKEKMKRRQKRKKKKKEDR